MRGYWRFLLDVRRCLRFDPGLPGRVITKGLRPNDFEDRVVTVMRWEDAEGISGHCMRLHRIGLTVSARREDYGSDMPWNYGSCWPELPAELNELPEALVHWLWWEPDPDPVAHEVGWSSLQSIGHDCWRRIRISSIHPITRLASVHSRRERRKCWLLRAAHPGSKIGVALLDRVSGPMHARQKIVDQ